MNIDIETDEVESGTGGPGEHGCVVPCSPDDLDLPPGPLTEAELEHAVSDDADRAQSARFGRRLEARFGIAQGDGEVDSPALLLAERPDDNASTAVYLGWRWVVGECIVSRPQEREREMREEDEGKKRARLSLVCAHVMVSWFDPTELAFALQILVGDCHWAWWDGWQAQEQGGAWLIMVTDHEIWDGWATAITPERVVFLRAGVYKYLALILVGRLEESPLVWVLNHPCTYQTVHAQRTCTRCGLVGLSFFVSAYLISTVPSAIEAPQLTVVNPAQKNFLDSHMSFYDGDGRGRSCRHKGTTVVIL
ncbi:hypothetical protein B0H14DRAFT_3631702 [Mycena olivaceomarginata]|nr:hypothetical protein B0H14DRAFT_3631702 [Mycena olivaceomarginata]